jgi:hypothetical protein
MTARSFDDTAVPPAVLPAASAYMTPDFIPIGDYAKSATKLSILVGYTKGAGATGGFKMRVFWRMPDGKVHPETLTNQIIGGLTADGFAWLNAYGLELQSPAWGIGTFYTGFQLDFYPGATAVQIQLAENITPATPGTAGYELTGWVERQT